MAHRKLLNIGQNLTYKEPNHFGLVIITVILIVILGGCALKGPYRCYLGSYSGRILDMESGEPIEGVVVHVTYSKYGDSAAGAIGTQVAVRETLTDADGKYLIPKDTVMHKCFSGKLEGRLQIFKPGYGYIGKARLSCPEEEREVVFRTGEPECVTLPGKYLIWELPKLKAKEERGDTLSRISPASRIPYENQSLLIKALNKERKKLGYSTYY